MYIWKLALRNLLGAKLRTWLNAFVLSISFVLIIGCQALYKSMTETMVTNSVNGLYGGGQYWQENYDPYDTLTLDDAHDKIPNALQTLIKENKAVAILRHTATLYPNNRLVNITLNGINHGQTVLDIPTSKLTAGQSRYDIPAVIGRKMAKNCNLNVGDTAMLRWRDAHGTFDAAEIRIVEIMYTDLSDIDEGQVWIALDKMQALSGLSGESTLIVLDKNFKTKAAEIFDGWTFKSLPTLLQPIRNMMTSEYMEAGILYAVFLFLAMLGIFDTQVLSIFRRKKEMGTMLALGITKSELIRIFTLEGALNSLLAAGLTIIYGTPLLVWFGKVGFSVESMDELGFGLGQTLYPIYTPGIIFGTGAVIIILTILVSYFPCRQISKLTPTEALRGTAK